MSFFQSFRSYTSYNYKFHQFDECRNILFWLHHSGQQFPFHRKERPRVHYKENSKAAEHQRSLVSHTYASVHSNALLVSFLPSSWMPTPFIPRSTLEHMPYALHDSPLRILTDWVRINPRWLSHVFPSAAMLVAAISNRVLTNVNLCAGNQRDWLFIWTHGSSWFKVLEYRCVSKNLSSSNHPFQARDRSISAMVAWYHYPAVSRFPSPKPPQNHLPHNLITSQAE